MIAGSELSFAYPGQEPLFQGLSLAVPDGGLLLVGGSSGCGKTTLLYCLCGIIPRNFKGAFSGAVVIDGRPVTDIPAAELPQNVAMVFQDPGTRMFLPAVEDEVAFTAENLCLSPLEIAEAVDKALELTGLCDLRDSHPAQLSGGQVKLCALACALVVPPCVLLLDEPTAGLDDAAIKRLYACLEWLRAQGSAIIVCDHRAELWPDAEVLDYAFI